MADVHYILPRLTVLNMDLDITLATILFFLSQLPYIISN